MTWLDHSGPLPAVPGEYRPADGCDYCDELACGVCPEHAATQCDARYSTRRCDGGADYWCADCERASCRYHSAPCDKCDRRAYDCCGLWWSEGPHYYHESVVLCRECIS